jgi:uncharacterized membrane protein YfcA
MKERTLVSAFAMMGSMTAYYYAKHHAKDPTPLLMLGGFVGALLGEVVSQVISKDAPSKKVSNNKEIESPKSKL